MNNDTDNNYSDRPAELSDLEVICKSCKWAGFTEEIIIVSDGGEWLNTCPNCGSTKIDYL